MEIERVVVIKEVSVYTMETKRLVLRELRDSDMEAIIAMLGSQTVMRLLFGGSPMTAQEAGVFINDNFYFGREICGIGVLCEKEGGSCVGFAGLLPAVISTKTTTKLVLPFRETNRAKGTPQKSEWRKSHTVSRIST